MKVIREVDDNEVRDAVIAWLETNHDIYIEAEHLTISETGLGFTFELDS